MPKEMIKRFFKLEENGTNIKREFLAGMTTFVTMSYIIFVNPNILADAGMPKEASFIATILAAFVSTALMGLIANLPLAVAPSMGLNAFFTYYVCGVVGLHWTVALGATFLSGIIFFTLSVTRIREFIIAAVPLNLKYSIVVGIGLFITVIGLKNSGIIIASPVTLVTLGDFTNPATLLACFGLLFSGALLAKQVTGALLYGIVVTTILGMFVGANPIPTGIHDIISFSIPDMTPVFLQLDILGALQFGIISIIFTFTIVELFDNMGTLIALLRKANLMDEKGEMKGLHKALVADSIGVIASAGIGTSTVSTYVESATGIASGGRTGLTALVIAFMFLVMLIFSPLISLVHGFATAPALILVGLFMVMDVVNVRFDDFTESLPSFLVIIMMPLSYSIANGFSFGFISYALLKLFTGRAKEVNVFVWIIATLFFISFIVSL